MTELYHVTFKSRVKTILSDGIIPKKKSIYKGIFAEIKDTGKIYAFENFDDAARWASRMSFDFGRPTIIVVFNDSIKGWERDVHFESAGSRGRWLKKEGSISPKNIKQIINHTPEMTKVVIQTLGTRKELRKDGSIR